MSGKTTSDPAPLTNQNPRLLVFQSAYPGESPTDIEKAGAIDAFDDGILPIEVVLAFQSATEATEVALTSQVFTSTEKGPHAKWSDE